MNKFIIAENILINTFHFCNLFFTNAHSMLRIRVARVHKNEYNAIKPKIEKNSFSVVLYKTKIIIIVFTQNNKIDKTTVINA